MAFSVTLKNLGAFAAASNLQLFLRKTSDNSLLNTGGDTGSDAASIGSFTWTVAEDRPAEQMLARIYEGSTETAANIIIDSVLNVGLTEIGAETAVLDSSTQAQIDAIEEALVGLAGTGARTVTITVNDGTTVLQNASVRVTEGANTFLAVTNSSGVATFNLDDATYTVAITKSGYSYAGTTLVVDGTETRTYSMTAISIPSPTQPDGCIIQVLCLNGVTPQQGVAIQYRAASIPSGDLNRAFLGTTQTATSNLSGIATFEVAQGSGFEWKRGDVVEWSSETAPAADTMDVQSVVGAAR